MNSDLIRAYLWREIVRLGFTPRKEKWSGWFLQYGHSLEDFWECGPCVTSQRLTAGAIDCPSLGISLEVSVTSNAKYTVRFLCAPSLKDELRMWLHDVDTEHFAVSKEINTKSVKRQTIIEKFTDADMKAVIDGLLLHPAVHQHIESPIDEHEIRIGGGIDNPFLFLFHLRYQLCPIETKRKKERDRLVNLFSQAVRCNAPITANALMKQPM
jgi:hypothetical protein